MDKLEVVAQEVRNAIYGAFIAGRVLCTATTGSVDERDARQYAEDLDLSGVLAPAQAEIDRLRERETYLSLAARELEARALAAEAEVSAVLAAIPGVRFMDPPDGGDPKPHERVQRMADTLKAAEAEVARLQRLLDDATGQLNTAEAQVFTLRAEREKDREALRPLAECDIPSDTLPDSDIGRYPFTMGEIRAARARLEDTHD